MGDKVESGGWRIGNYAATPMDMEVGAIGRMMKADWEETAAGVARALDNPFYMFKAIEKVKTRRGISYYIEEVLSAYVDILAGRMVVWNDVLDILGQQENMGGIVEKLIGDRLRQALEKTEGGDVASFTGYSSSLFWKVMCRSRHVSFAIDYIRTGQFSLKHSGLDLQRLDWAGVWTAALENAELTCQGRKAVMSLVLENCRWLLENLGGAPYYAGESDAARDAIWRAYSVSVARLALGDDERQEALGELKRIDGYNEPHLRAMVRGMDKDSVIEVLAKADVIMQSLDDGARVVRQPSGRDRLAGLVLYALCRDDIEEAVRSDMLERHIIQNIDGGVDYIKEAMAQDNSGAREVCRLLWKICRKAGVTAKSEDTIRRLTFADGAQRQTSLGQHMNIDMAVVMLNGTLDVQILLAIADRCGDDEEVFDLLAARKDAAVMATLITKAPDEDRFNSALSWLGTRSRVPKTNRRQGISYAVSALKSCEHGYRISTATMAQLLKASDGLDREAKSVLMGYVARVKTTSAAARDKGGR